MAKLVTLHDANGEIIYPQSVWDKNMIPDNTVKSSMIDWTTMPGSYSTTEQKTPFTWVNGKPIYKKTISTGALPENGATTTTDISSLSVDTIVDYRGMAWASSSKNFRALPFVGEPMDSMIRVDVNGGTTLRILTTASSGWGSYDNSYVTLWYTKTTD